MTVLIAVSVDSRGAIKNVQTLSGQVRGLGRETTLTQRALASMAGSARALGLGLTVGLTAPIVGLATTAVQTSISFESAFAGVRKTVNATDEQFRALEGEIRSLAKAIPVSANELARIGEAAGQLGIKTENLIGFTQVMAKLGVTTNLTSDQAATDLARLANVTQMPQTEFENLGSTIVALGNNFATTEAEITSMALRIAGAGKQVGLSEAQILAVGTALSSVGIEAEAGGSAISKVMIQIASAVSEGGKELDLFARISGMSSADFSRAWKTDAAGALNSFISGLGAMKSSGEDVLGALKALGIEEVRMRDALLRASGAGDLLARALDVGASAWREHSALNREAEERFKTTESQLALLWNRVKDVGITLGGALNPALRAAIGILDALLPKLEGAVKWFAALPAGAQLTTVGILGLVAAAGPALVIFAQMATGVSALIGLYQSLGLATALASAQAAVATTTMRAAALVTAATAPAMAVLNGWVFALGNSVPVLAVRLGVLNATTALTAASAKVAAVAKGLLTAAMTLAGNTAQFLAVRLGLAAAASRLMAFASGAAAAASGGLATALSVVGVAAAAAAAGFAGFKLGQWIDETTGLSDVLGGWIARLYGVSDAEYQASLAAQKAFEANQKLAGSVEDLSRSYATLKDRISGAGLARDMGQLNTVMEELAVGGALDMATLGRIATEAKRLADQGQQLTPALQNVVDAFDRMQPASTGAARGLGDYGKAADEAAEAAERHAEMIARLADTLSGGDLVARASNLAEALSMPGVFDAVTSNKALLRSLHDEIEQLVQGGLRDLPPALEQVQDAFDQMQVPATLPTMTVPMTARTAAATGDVGLTAPTRTIEISDKGLKSVDDVIEEAKKKTIDWGRALDQVRNLLDVLGISADSAFAQVLGGITAAMAGIESLDRGWQSFQANLSAFRASGGKDGFGGMASAAVSLGASVLQIGQSFLSVTDTANGALRAIGGAAMGAQLGAKFAGPWGAAIGAAIGGVAGLFRKPSWIKVGKEAGQVLGLAAGESLSKELSKQIEATSKSLGVSIKSATLLHLQDAAEETGKTFHELAPQIFELMAGVASGAIPAAQGTQAIADAWSRVREEADAAGTVGDAVSVAMLKAAQMTGTLTAEMKAFLSEHRREIVDNTTLLEEGLSKVDLSKVSAEWGQRAARSFAFGFDQARSELGILGALDEFGESIKEQYDALIKAGNSAAAAALAPAVQLQNLLGDPKNEHLRGMLEVQQAQAGIVKGAAETGDLTQQMVNDLGGTIGETLQQLQAAGLSSQEAFKVAMPDLVALVQASQQYGFELDSNTAALVSQAEAMGFAFPPEPQQVMIDLLSEMVRLMGGELPESAQRGAAGVENSMGQAAQNSAGAWREAGRDIVSEYEFVKAESELAGQFVQQSFVSNLQEIAGVHLPQMKPAWEAGFMGLTEAADPGLNSLRGKLGGILGMLDSIPEKATAAGQSIDDAFGDGGGPGPGDGTGQKDAPPGLAAGAVVNSPHLAVFGEAGPEVVAPVQALFGHLGAMMARAVVADLAPFLVARPGTGPGGGDGTSIVFEPGAIQIHVGGSWRGAIPEDLRQAVEDGVVAAYRSNRPRVVHHSRRRA